MTSKPLITAQSPLAETLASLTNDDLKPRAQFCIKNAPTRKSDLIDVIVSALNTPETLQHLWSQLNDLSRQTVAAAIEHGGQLNEDAFRAQYRALPWDEQKKKKFIVELSTGVFADRCFPVSRPHSTRCDSVAEAAGATTDTVCR